MFGFEGGFFELTGSGDNTPKFPLEASEGKKHSRNMSPQTSCGVMPPLSDVTIPSVTTLYHNCLEPNVSLAGSPSFHSNQKSLSTDDIDVISNTLTMVLNDRTSVVPVAPWAENTQKGVLQRAGYDSEDYMLEWSLEQRLNNVSAAWDRCHQRSLADLDRRMKNEGKLLEKIYSQR